MGKVVILFSLFWIAIFSIGAGFRVSGNTFPSTKSCKYWAICVDEAGTGPCQDSGNTKEMTAFLEGRSNITFDSTASGATVWACDLYTNSTGYTATALDKQKINSTSLSNMDKVLSYNFGPLLHVWAECGTNTGTDIDVMVTACE